MGRKFEITGKAVIYTAEGVKVVDAEVRRRFNANADDCTFKYKCTEPHILIGGARTVPTDNHYAQPAYHPEKIPQAVSFGQTKFIWLMVDLMKLAQWEPHDMIFTEYFRENRQTLNWSPIDWDAPLDEQFYRLLDFTPPMIEFVEERYATTRADK